MSRINEIEEGLRQIEGGRFQTLANQYLFRKYDLDGFVALGSNFGTDKTTVGIPDAYAVKNGRYTFMAFTASTSDIRGKLLNDANDCLDEEKTGINLDSVDRIILCHTTSRLSPDVHSQIHALDSRIEIIGPEMIAQDLDQKYPVLAHLNLGTPLGNGSFISPEVFANRQLSGRFSTNQSGQLIYRDEELGDFTNLLAQSRVLIVEGCSGCGKSKLALDGCRQFCIDNNKDLLILESKNSVGADEDIELFVKDSQDAVVLVDDANSQTSLVHLLQACADNPRLKLVMTVREFSKRALEGLVGQHLDFDTLQLKPLSNEEIDSILETQYGIKSSSYRERITRIANGNLRLAIMASLSVSEGDGKALKEPYDLLNAYMVPALRNYSVDQISILETAAIFDTCDFSDGDECYEYMRGLGLPLETARDLFSDLNEKEIVTMMTSREGVLAIRMEEQNLRDYLICRFFIKEHRARLSDLIIQYASSQAKPYIRAARSLVEVCGSEFVLEYVKGECRDAWDRLSNENTQTKEEFMAVFHGFVPAQALVFTRELIERKSGHNVSGEIQEGSTSSSASIALSLIMSLIDDEDYEGAALNLLMHCTEKGTEEAACYKNAYGVEGAFSSRSGRTEFDVEEKKLRMLSEAFIQTGSSNIAACLITIVETYLHGYYARSTFSGGRPAICSGVYGYGPGLAKLQAECFRALACLVGTEYEERIVRMFEIQFTWLGENCSDDWMNHKGLVLVDISNLIPVYICKDSIGALRCWRCIEAICSKKGIANPVDPSLFSSTTVDALAFEDADIFFGEPAVLPDTSKWPLGRYARSLAELAEDYNAGSHPTEAIGAIMLLLEAASNHIPNHAMSLIGEYAKGISPQALSPDKALGNLSGTFGREKVRNEIESLENFPVVRKMVDCVDCIALGDNPTSGELDKMLKELSDNCFHQRLNDVLKGNIIQKNFSQQYTNRYAAQANKDPMEVNDYLGNGYDKEHIENIQNAFASNSSSLQKLYFEAMGYSNFDYNFAFLGCFAELDPSFLDAFFDKIASFDYGETYSLYGKVNLLWESSEPYAWPLLKRFIKHALLNVSSSLALQCLVSRTSPGELYRDKFWEIIERFIAQNIGDAAKMRQLTWSFSDSDDASRVRLLSMVISMDCNETHVGNLYLRKSSMSGTMEGGFVGEKYREIEVLNEVIRNIPQNSVHLKYHAWLDGAKGEIEADIEKEQWDLYHNRG